MLLIIIERLTWPGHGLRSRRMSSRNDGGNKCCICPVKPD